MSNRSGVWTLLVKVNKYDPKTLICSSYFFLELVKVLWELEVYATVNWEDGENHNKYIMSQTGVGGPLLFLHACCLLLILPPFSLSTFFILLGG